jgi:hypothetical protein
MATRWGDSLFTWAVAWFNIEPQTATLVKTRTWPVGGHNHLHLTQHVKPVQLIQQLHQRALNLAIRRRALAEAPPANRVHLPT